MDCSHKNIQDKDTEKINQKGKDRCLKKLAYAAIMQVFVIKKK